MELAQSKVSQCESECQNQNLQHQLNALIAKTATQQIANSTSHPWKLKWDNVVNNIPSVAQNIPTRESFKSHISDIAQQIQLNSFDETK